MAEIEKDLFSFDYPEFKTESCVTGWTWVPCPTWREPGRTCKSNIYGICTRTKTSRFRVFVKVEYPDSFEDEVKKQIEQCHLGAVGVATNTIYAAATASTIIGPQATIAAAIGSIPAAAKAYGLSFYGCLGALPLVNKDLVKANIHREDKAINDWH